MDSPTTIDRSFDSPAAGSTNMLSPGRQLLHRLRDEGVILPDEWDALSSDRQKLVAGATSKEDMIVSLADVGLLTEFQASRVLAGGAHHLVFGNYRIIERIGAGGMGVVYRGEHTLMRRPVAIKVLQASLDEDKTTLHRFFAETRALALIRHTNIVWAFDAGSIRPADLESYWWHYLVMELLSGSDLERLVSTTPLSPTRACDIIYQIAGALDETHKHNLIHRDIKPSNIVVSSDGVAKLLDFGLALHFRQRRVTDPGTLLGSINYMAPEQVVDAATVDNRTDIFGLGATLYYCLTGRAPFIAEGSMTHQIASRLKEPSFDLCRDRPEIPKELESVVRRMMAYQREDRFPNPQSVMRALLPFVGSAGPATSEVIMGCVRPEEAVATPASARRILIVDDEPGVRKVCRSFFKHEGFDCEEAVDGEDAIRIVSEKAFDVVVLDIEMPRMSGTEVLRRLRQSQVGGNIKVIMMSGGIDADDLSKLLAMGANDYLTKPLSHIELIARVKAALTRKAARDRTEQLNHELLLVNAQLEKNLTARKSDLAETRNAIVVALAKIVESRSPWTTDHMGRVARYASRLAQSARQLPTFATVINEPFLRTLESCAILHDIGKVAMSDEIMRNIDNLDAEDQFTMQTHTTIGAETLASVAKRDKGAVAFWQMAIDIARHHHERFDGKGYPDRLAGCEIPLAARIVAIADVYDTMRTRPTHGNVAAHAEAVARIVQQATTAYDPLLLEAFKCCEHDFAVIANS
jgi:response regulator RpfG family c-di-GMP phosphodiesterase/tRNA A-37 threonylcarbamoyl transferase component Bud32